jgi:hypothetical protein
MTMKTGAFFLFLIAMPFWAIAGDVNIGDSLDTVRSVLGPPSGQVQIGNKLLLDYARGQVILVDGRVVQTDLLSPEELAKKQAQHVADGQALKAQKLAYWKCFPGSPSVQVAFWQDFRLRYPEVPCNDEYIQAQSALQESKVEEAANRAAAQQAENEAAEQAAAAQAANQQPAAPQEDQEPSYWELVAKYKAEHHTDEATAEEGVSKTFNPYIKR